MGVVPDQRRDEVSVFSDVDAVTARSLYELYLDTFGEMAYLAVNRHLLHEHEFMAVMHDQRVTKYVVRGRDGRTPVAMCTLTNDLTTVPWVSPDYYAHHYPDHTARKAVYFLGFILVGREHRRTHVFSRLVEQVAETLVDQEAICGYDICGFNLEERRMADVITRVLGEVGAIEVREEDVQTFYTAVAPARSPETSRMPWQRPTLASRSQAGSVPTGPREVRT